MKPMKPPTEHGISFLREIVRYEREHLKRLQLAIETRADDLNTLYRLAAAAAEDLARSETHLKRKEEELMRHNDANNES